MIPSNLIGCAFAFACKYSSKKSLRSFWLFRETNGIGGIIFFFLDGGREVLVGVAFVFFF